MTLSIGYLTKQFALVIIMTILLLIVGLFANHITFPSLLYTNALFPVILVIIILKYLVKEPKRSNVEKKNKINFQILKNNFKNMQKIWMLLSIICFLNVGKLNENFIFIMAMKNFNMSKYTIPFIFTVMYIFVTITSMFFGWLIDKKKSFLVLFMTIFFLFLGHLLMYTTTSLFLFWISLIFISIFLAGSDSAITSIISFLIPDANIKATVYGLVYGISGLLSILNAFLVMIFSGVYSIKEMYGLSLIPIFISLIILIFTRNLFLQKLKQE
jgi:MFS family permease